MACDWPGNVRQLQNVLERAAVFSDSQEITPEHLQEVTELEVWRWPQISIATGGRADELGGSASPSHLCGECGAAEPACCTSRYDSWPTLAECECRLIRQTLERTFSNQSAAARLLGIDWRQFARKMNKYGISGASLPCPQRTDAGCKTRSPPDRKS